MIFYWDMISYLLILILLWLCWHNNHYHVSIAIILPIQIRLLGEETHAKIDFDRIMTTGSLTQR